MRTGRTNLCRALEKFRGALRFRPDLDVAIQYAELAEWQNDDCHGANASRLAEAFCCS